MLIFRRANDLKLCTYALRRASIAAFLGENDEALQVAPIKSENALKEDQVRIQVKFCSLNSNDVKHLKNGKYTLPHIPGYELSGEILEVNKDNDDCELQVGQNVVAIAPERCGGLASQILLNHRDVWPLPTNVAVEDAAAIVCGHSTALLAFTEKRPLQESDTILVIAGAGGFGLAAVDVAASVFKSKVIALADTEGKANILRERGAFAAFKNDLKHNYKEIMNATDGKGVDVIYDAVGGSILNTVIKCLKDKENGVILTTYQRTDLEDINIKTDSDADNDKRKKKDKKEDAKISNEVLDKMHTVSLTDCRNEDHDKYYSIVEQVLEYSDDGLISAHVSKRFQIEKINEAIEYIKGKMCTGKVLIEIDKT